MSDAHGPPWGTTNTTLAMQPAILITLAKLRILPRATTVMTWAHGERHPDERLRPIWNVYAAGVDVVVNGHVHNYERFAPRDPDAKADPIRGIREFIVGTGGKSHQAFVQVRPNSEVRNNDSYGVLKLVLTPGRYTWQFIPVPGASFADSGHGDCHG